MFIWNLSLFFFIYILVAQDSGIHKPLLLIGSFSRTSGQLLSCIHSTLPSSQLYVRVGYYIKSNFCVLPKTVKMECLSPKQAQLISSDCILTPHPNTTTQSLLPLSLFAACIRRKYRMKIPFFYMVCV